jgi:hypothetical protein
MSYSKTFTIRTVPAPVLTIMQTTLLRRPKPFSLVFRTQPDPLLFSLPTQVSFTLNEVGDPT